MLSPTCAIRVIPGGTPRPPFLSLLPRAGWLHRLFDRIEAPGDPR